MTEATAFSLGQQLKAARQALNLSIEDIAERTNLKKNHLQALEDDIFILSGIPPAFVRGYVRNYVRFLRLPEELVETVNYGEVSLAKQQTKRAVSMPVKNNHKSQLRWVKCLTWLILLGAIGMTLAWWWQEYKKEQASSDQLVNHSLIATKTETHTQPEPATLEMPVPTQDKTDVATERDAKVEHKKTAQTFEEVVMTQVSEVSKPSEVVPVKNMEAISEPQPPVNILQVVQADTAKEEIESTSNANVAITDELRIEITGVNSWIAVRGEKNKKLAEKLYNEGEVLTFNGNEQYRLTVGAPANVKIYYKGELVPLKVDGRVARFKLPLAN